MEPLIILSSINSVFAIAFGIFVFAKNPHKAVNRALALLAFFLGIWGIANFIPLDPKILELIAFGGMVFSIAANLHLTQTLIGDNKYKLIIGGYVFALFTLAISCLVFLKKDLLLASDILVFNHQACLLIGIILLIIPFFLLMNAAQNNVGLKKYQLKFIALEYSIALLVSTILLTLNFDVEKNIIANVSNSPHFVGALHLFVVFYLFAEYKFLRFKTIILGFLKRFIALSLAIIISLNFYYFINSTSFNIPEKLVIIFIMIIAVFAYSFILRFFKLQQWLNTISLENFRKTVIEFKNQNIFYASVEELQQDIQLNLCPRAEIEEAQVIVLDLDSKEAKFPQLEKYFTKNSNHLVTAEEEYLLNSKHIECPYFTELKSLGDVCFPLFQHTNELIGFFIIRKSVGSDIYIAEELQLLKEAVHYIALSLMGILYTEKLRQQSGKLREDYEKLKTLDSAKDAFIANVSHELRTPATAIKGYSSMLVAPTFGELSEKQKDFASKIEKNTNWLLTLLNDILEITKLENKQIKFKFTKIEVRKLLEEVTEKWKKPCEKKGLKFKLRLDFKDPTLALQTDSEYLAEVLDRLLTNACKFTEKGEILISAKLEGEFLKIAVSDTGVGISTNKLTKVWDRFFQSADFLEKSDTGAGLGLAIVKKLVENLDGNISVSSELGKGSVFTLLIPF